LKAQLKTASEELEEQKNRAEAEYTEITEEQKNRAEAEYTEITEELKMLLSALGISSMEWERAKSLGKLPTGQLL
jgi:predicted nuclease with TOPRIM domain